MAAKGTGAVLRQMEAIFRGGAVAGLSDAELLERFASRSDEAVAEAAFSAIVARHGPMVLGVCRKAVSDPIEAEDAFQATFLVLARKAGSVRVDDSAGRWLYGVARKVANRARKRSGNRREVTVEAVPEAASTAPDPLDAVLTRERSELLRAEVARLPTRYREAIELCHLEGRSLDEAAARLGRPVGTIKARLSRARAMLRARLSRIGFDAGMLPVVPGPLLHRTIKLAVRDAFQTVPIGGIAGASAVSGSIINLAEGVLAMTGWAKVQAAGIAALSVGVTAAAVGGLADRSESTDAQGDPLLVPTLGRKVLEDGPLPSVTERLREPQVKTAGAIKQLKKTLDALVKQADDERERKERLELLLKYRDVSVEAIRRNLADAEDRVEAYHQEIDRLGAILQQLREEEPIEAEPSLDSDPLIRNAPIRAMERPVEPGSDGGPIDPQDLDKVVWDPEKVEDRDDGLGPDREAERAAAPEYVVEPPDMIRIEVLVGLPGRPITGERLVRPDGRISLDFYGDIHVEGLTLSEVKEKVILHLREFLTDESLGLVELDPWTLKPIMKRPKDSNRVFVDVAQYNSKVYYVQGGVAAPGRLVITGNETVLDAINFAGGLLPTADPENIRLIRPAEPGSREEAEVLMVDLEAIVSEGDTATNYQIKAGDRLVVSREPERIVEQEFLNHEEVAAIRDELKALDEKIVQMQRIVRNPDDPAIRQLLARRDELRKLYRGHWEELAPKLRERLGVDPAVSDEDEGPPPIDGREVDLYRFTEPRDADGAGGSAASPEVLESLRTLVEKLDAMAGREEPGTFTVTGGVQTPGRFLIPGELTITDALELTGGTGDVPGTVFLLRRGEPIRKFYTIRGSLGRGEEDVIIQPGDQLVIRTYPQIAPTQPETPSTGSPFDGDVLTDEPDSPPAQ